MGTLGTSPFSRSMAFALSFSSTTSEADFDFVVPFFGHFTKLRRRELMKAAECTSPPIEESERSSGMPCPATTSFAARRQTSETHTCLAKPR